jgi:homoserine dehydrogenase
VVPNPRRPQGRVVDLPLTVRKVALLGFGTVGSSVAEILCSNHFPNLQLTCIFNRNVARKRQPWVPAAVRWTEDIHEVLASDADIVVEVLGGLEPTADWIELMLRAGKNVVTANKHLIATRGRELTKLAQAEGRRLEYGASVAGGVPVLNAVSAGLAGEALLRLQGVLNGTCNYILSNMDASGMAFDKALARAQELGYAEADPSDDIHGIDARCKLAILAHTGFGLHVAPEQIEVRSIVGITEEDFHQARKRGRTIRQVSAAERTASGLRAVVQPAMVRMNSSLGQVRDNQNVLVTTGHWGGETTFAGRGAGGGPTAVAVVSDLLAIARHQALAGPRAESAATEVQCDFQFPHYLRAEVADAKESARLEVALHEAGLAIEESKTSRKRRNDRKNAITRILLLKPSTTARVEEALRAWGGQRPHFCLPLVD